MQAKQAKKLYCVGCLKKKKNKTNHLDMKTGETNTF